MSADTSHSPSSPPLIILSCANADNQIDRVLLPMPSTLIQARADAKNIFFLSCPSSLIQLYIKIQTVEVGIMDLAWDHLPSLVKSGEILEILVKVIEEESEFGKNLLREEKVRMEMELERLIRREKDEGSKFQEQDEKNEFESQYTILEEEEEEDFVKLANKDAS